MLSGLGDRVAVCPVGQVAGDQHAFAAGFFDVARDVFGIVVLVEVGDQHVGALSGERDRYGAADSALTTADDRPLADPLSEPR